MHYSKDEVEAKIKELGDMIHAVNQSKQKQIEEYRHDIHYYIAHSDVLYEEAWDMLREAYPINEEFYPAMNRTRETIYKRNKK